jgi:hypothetical protein
MQKAYIDSKRFDKFFNFLLQEGYIKRYSPGESYYLTESGEKLLKGLKEIGYIFDNKVEFLKFIVPLIIFVHSGQISSGWAS